MFNSYQIITNKNTLNTFRRKTLLQTNQLIQSQNIIE